MRDAGECVDPARGCGRAACTTPQVKEVKWTDADFADYKEGRLPMGQATDPEWAIGDINRGIQEGCAGPG